MITVNMLKEENKKNSFGFLQKYILKYIVILLLPIYFLGCSNSAYYTRPLKEISNPHVISNIEARFESRINTSTDTFIGRTALGTVGLGTAIMVAGIKNSNGATIGSGATGVGIGLGIALIGDIATKSNMERLYLEAYNALLTESQKTHTEAIDIRNIRFSKVNNVGTSRIYQYNASGVIIRQ